MSKVKNMCLKVAEKTNNKKLAVKLSLLSNATANNTVLLSDVFEDISHFVSSKEFSGYLSVLTKEGFYEACLDSEYKGLWGYIKP